MKLTVYKVPGETNTDDLSPASEAFTRSDIPLHANSMLQNRMEKPLETIAKLKEKGNDLVYVGDVVGTGSSRSEYKFNILLSMGQSVWIKDILRSSKYKGSWLAVVIRVSYYCSYFHVNTLTEDSGL